LTTKRQKRQAMHRVNIIGAEKKLRQAKFFLGLLEEASTTKGDVERLEFVYSACLTAAQSVFYVLNATGGGNFKRIHQQWRERLPEVERSKFNKMVGRRDDDVHHASTDTELLGKAVPESRTAYRIVEPHIFGEPAVVEWENPDGTRVSAPVLRGAIGLYIEQQGRPVEATTACREFIERLQSLLADVKAATGTE